MTQEDIKVYRLKARISQKELAQLIDVNQNTLGRWEQGYSRCSPEMMKRIKMALLYLPAPLE